MARASSRPPARALRSSRSLPGDLEKQREANSSVKKKKNTISLEHRNKKPNKNSDPRQRAMQNNPDVPYGRKGAPQYTATANHPDAAPHWAIIRPDGKYCPLSMKEAMCSRPCASELSLSVPCTQILPSSPSSSSRHSPPHLPPPFAPIPMSPLNQGWTSLPFDLTSPSTSAYESSVCSGISYPQNHTQRTDQYAYEMGPTLASPSTGVWIGEFHHPNPSLPVLSPDSGSLSISQYSATSDPSTSHSSSPLVHFNLGLYSLPLTPSSNNWVSSNVDFGHGADIESHLPMQVQMQMFNDLGVSSGGASCPPPAKQYDPRETLGLFGTQQAYALDQAPRIYFPSLLGGYDDPNLSSLSQAPYLPGMMHPSQSQGIARLR